MIIKKNDGQDNEKKNSLPDKSKTNFYENDGAENVSLSNSVEKKKKLL